MDSYIDLTLLPDPEFPEATLINALFAKFHRGLVDFGEGEIAISFPEYHKTGLGSTFRLHGTAQALDKFLSGTWLKGMQDHLTQSDLLPVPETHRFCVVKRVQVKSNAERLRRRAIKTGRLTEEQALIQIPNSKEQRTQLPFVVVASRSTQQKFKLFIEHKMVDKQQAGQFNSYGLSQQATIPWF